MGPGSMHLWVLSELAEVIARPVSTAFGKSWQTGEALGEWRKAKVTPAFKKGKREDLGSYRMVSLTSIPGKVVEQLIPGAVLRHIKKRRVISSNQHGFIKAKSCLTNLLWLNLCVPE